MMPDFTDVSTGRERSFPSQYLFLIYHHCFEGKICIVASSIEVAEIALSLAPVPALTTATAQAGTQARIESKTEADT